MKFKSIKLIQDNICMYMLKMTADELLESYEIQRYDSVTNTGYQRAPIPAHYRRIASYFMTESKPILPTAIVAAISSESIIDEDGVIELKEKMRIVDGQHRIEGLNSLKKEFNEAGKNRYEEIKKAFEFPIILMVIGPEDDEIEMDAFININSKGKRVRTDLAETVKSNKRSKRNSSETELAVNDDLINDISLEICRKLNSDSNSFWKGLIVQADEIGSRSEQPITVITFMQAIKPVVSMKLQQYKKINGEELKLVISDISNVILDIWDVVIDKWPGCFNGKQRSFDKAYNICKGLGLIPIIQIYCNQSTKSENMLDTFAEVIKNSKVMERDWLVGGSFTGLSSGQGKTTIRKYICGEIESIYEV